MKEYENAKYVEVTVDEAPITEYCDMDSLKCKDSPFEFVHILEDYFRGFESCHTPRDKVEIFYGMVKLNCLTLRGFNLMAELWDTQTRFDFQVSGQGVIEELTKSSQINNYLNTCDTVFLKDLNGEEYCTFSITLPTKRESSGLLEIIASELWRAGITALLFEIPKPSSAPERRYDCALFLKEVHKKENFSFVQDCGSHVLANLDVVSQKVEMSAETAMRMLKVKELPSTMEVEPITE